MASTRGGISLGLQTTPSSADYIDAPASAPLYATIMPDGTKVISHNPPTVASNYQVAPVTVDHSQLIKYAAIGLAIYFLLKK